MIRRHSSSGYSDDGHGRARDAGIVDEDIDAAEVGLRSGARPRHRCRVGLLHGDGDCLSAAARERRDGLRRLAFVPVPQATVAPESARRWATAKPMPCAAPCDDRYAALKVDFVPHF